MSATSLVAVIHGVVGIAIIAAVTVLLSLHDLTESTALALYTAGLAFAGSATGITLAAQIPASTDKPPA